MVDDIEQKMRAAAQWLHDNPPTAEEIEALQEESRRRGWKDPLALLLEIAEDETAPLATRHRAALSAAPYMIRH
jgi:hypothetical protein